MISSASFRQTIVSGINRRHHKAARGSCAPFPGAEKDDHTAVVNPRYGGRAEQSLGSNAQPPLWRSP